MLACVTVNAVLPTTTMEAWSTSSFAKVKCAVLFAPNIVVADTDSVKESASGMLLPGISMDELVSLMPLAVNADQDAVHWNDGSVEPTTPFNCAIAWIPSHLFRVAGTF